MGTPTSGGSSVKLPATINPEQVTAIIDTDEQLPLDLSPLKTIVQHLYTGDYSIVGLESVVAIERKSFSDFLKCVGTDRDRFEKQIQRLLAFPVRALVIEATWADIEKGQWRSKVTPQSALGSLMGWIAMGLPVIMAGDHERAGRFVSRLLFIAARRRWRENRTLATHVLTPSETSETPLTAPTG